METAVEHEHVSREWGRSSGPSSRVCVIKKHYVYGCGGRHRNLEFVCV